MNFEQSDALIKYAKIDASSTGGDVVAAVVGKRIRVISLFLTITTAAGTVKFQSGGSTDLTGAMTFAAGGVQTLPHNPSGWFQTVAGEKLNMVLASAGQVSGALTYQEIG